MQESLQLARRDLVLEADIDLEGSENAYDRLLDFLEKEINHLLDRDFQHLLNSLYRIDIDELTVKKILSEKESGDIARELAKVIIEREKQKVITRQQHRPS